MATKIITKNSSTATSIPTAGDLVQGELAVNVTDKRLFTEDSGGAIVELGTSPSTIDINAGTIDGTVIGGTTAAAGSFTTGTFSSTLSFSSLFAASTPIITLRENGNSLLQVGTSAGYGMRLSAPSDATDAISVGTVSITDGTTYSELFKVASSGAATFSASSGLLTLTATSAGTPSNYISFADTGGQTAFVGHAGGGDDHLYVSNSTATGDLILSTNNTARLTIGTTGVATFSSTVTGTQFSSTSSSAALPSFGVTAGNGMYNPATNSIGWSTNSVERLRLDSGGNLSLYQNQELRWQWQPNDYIRGAISVDASNNMSFQTAYTERMRLDASGNVGIGGNPIGSARLGLSKSAGGDVFVVTDTTSADLIVNCSAGVTRISPSTGILALGTGNVEKMRIDASGKLSINTTSATAAYLKAAGVYGASYAASFLTNSANSSAVVVFENTNGIVGNIGTSGSSTSYNTSSDYRLKEDDVPMTGATERVKALRPINFAWKVDGSRTDGFFAHEAQEVVPECSTGTKDAMRDEEYEVTPAVEEVRDEDDNIITEAVAAVMGTRSVPDYQGIDQSKLVPLLTATIQELIARIEALEGA